MPPQLLEQFTEYANEYAKIKRGRKLAWMDHLGTVDVEIQLKDREVTVEASPIQTAVLYAFEDYGMKSLLFQSNSDQLTIDDLSKLVGINSISVKRAVLFWVLHGVLKEVAPDTFHVLEHAEAASPTQSILSNFYF
jgi:anaphase-promoting complex subunit 2